MESNLSSLKPEKVFKFFSEICAIPHGSGNLDGIVNYLANFAKDRNLEYIVDEYKNVIIKTKSVEAGDPIILQAHIDMVCVKTPNSKKDMAKDPIEIYVDGEYLQARETSLGADDGIGVAIILAILDDIVNDSFKGFAIEALFTSDEETGMTGAIGVDGKLFKGKKLINIDSEDEGVLTVSCAGGTQAKSEMPIKRVDNLSDIKKDYKNYSIRLTGLLGGHSGMEIHKGRANAICELAYVLRMMLDENIDFYLNSIDGGKFENVICPDAESLVLVKNSDVDKFQNLILKLNEKLKNEYILTDSNIKIVIESVENLKTLMTKDSAINLIDTIFSLPQGLIEISQEFSNLPWTSLNLGIVETNDDKIILTTFFRSNEDLKKEKIVKKYKTIVEDHGGKFVIYGEYPAWQYNKTSKFKEALIKTYKELYDKDMKIEATHGGLECGLLIQKIEGLEAFSIGPTVLGVHSTDEKLKIDTVAKIYDFIKYFISK